MKNAILVLGMHRSGTSAIAGMMSKLGAVSPRSLMAPDQRNAKGYFESVLFWHFHDRMLESVGSNWHDWRPFDISRLAATRADLEAEAERLLREEFGDAPLFVLKDPRICRFVPLWLSIFDKLEITPRIVIPFRAPFEVVKSLRAREELSIEKGLLMWLRHTLDAERQTRHLPRSCVSMDDLMEDWRGCARRISQDTGITWPTFNETSSAEIDEFLSRDLKHHAEIVEPGRTREWVLRVYEAMQVLSRTPRSPLALAILDEVNEGFDQAIALFCAEWTELVAHAQRVEHNAVAIAAERDALRERQNEAPKVVLDVYQKPVVKSDPVDLDRLYGLTNETQGIRRKLHKLRDQLADGSAAG